MERDDQSTETPEISEEALDERGRGHKRRFSSVNLSGFFQGLNRAVLGISKRLTSTAKRTYGSVFKAQEASSTLDDIKGAFRHIPLRKKGLGYLLVGFVLSIYLLSGLYTVKPGEEAVSRIFGKEVRRNISEGLHYRLPFPFEAVEKVNVMEIRRIEVGAPISGGPLLFPKKSLTSQPSSAEGHLGHGVHGAHGSPPKVAGNTPPKPSSAKNQFLTGDENILEIRMNIQYRIKDASDYLFNMNSPDSVVPHAARAAITEIFGGMRVDDLLTVAKSQMQKKIAVTAQKMLDAYSTGLHIVSVNLQEVNPPKEAAQAFRDVASAKEEREEMINKAQGYWNAVIPEARGNAHQLISRAEGYKEEVKNRSSGDGEKFSAMLAEYRGAKEVTEYRLYLETIEKILAKTKKFVVDSKKERVNLKFIK